MNKRSLTAVLAAVLVFTAFGQGSPFDGKKFPKFKMTDTHGQTFTNKALKGKVVLIDFWATWCPPCVQATPYLQKLQDKYRSRGLVVIGANAAEHSADAYKNGARRFATKHGLKYRMTVGNDDLAQTLQVEGFPTVFIVDRKGIIRRVLVGFGPEEVPVWEATIEKLLAQK